MVIYLKGICLLSSPSGKGETVNMSYAPFKIRIYAFLLDYLVIVMYGMFVVGTISFVFRSFITPLFSISPVIAELTGFFMMTLPVSLYFILCERSRWQGTWGKKKMGIRVVDSEGQRIELGGAVIRTAFMLLPGEVASFGICQFILPSIFSEVTVFVILNIVHITVL